MKQSKFTNRLVNETSPYLLKHAHNPVDWYPWCDEAFEKARKEDKLVLVSIGYSACHWCHVMEDESFESEHLADIMNEHFVCIKVDREERPDIDQIYMTAVQIMTGQGGWPLNCFTLSDGRPIYGGTYFPPHKWEEVLRALNKFWVENPERTMQYATELTQGVKQAELIEKEQSAYDRWDSILKELITNWKELFDKEEGGNKRAPKFPLPNNYEFLLRYCYHTEDVEVRAHLQLTLDKMALGGIFDQIGGGFARYSTDVYWKVPHFEKMLYDNAQLISLYSQAYQYFQKPLYKEVVYETIQFLTKELTSADGALYSALDADTEGIEGKYYVWNKEEFKAIVAEYSPLLEEYWSLNEQGLWEDGHYILLRSQDDDAFVSAHQLELNEWKKTVQLAKSKLFDFRAKREKPALDDKQLTAWNALALKAYIDAYNAFADESFLREAYQIARFLGQQQDIHSQGLWRKYKNGEASIVAYLEDYAAVIQAYIALYEATMEEEWLTEACRLAEYTIEHFWDEITSMFFFTASNDKPLIARKMEINDNVIPASNSIMARNLFRLSYYGNNPVYREMAEQMLSNVSKNMARYGSGYSNWGQLLMELSFPFYEVVIVGEEAKQVVKKLLHIYLPNKLVAASVQEKDTGLFEGRPSEGRTRLFLCQNQSCLLPTEEVPEVIRQIKKA